MDISFTTVVNSLFFSAVAIALLCCMIDRTKVVSGRKFGFFSFILIMIMLRLFVPCEILGIQNNVYITRIYPDVYLFLTKTNLTFMGREWSVASILIMFSLIGSIVCAVKLFLSYFAVFLTLKRYRVADSEMIRETVSAINQKWGKNVAFRIAQNREITVPFLFGMWRPIIVLPEISFSEEEWYYILSHEMAHYYHRDLWLRFICEMLQVVYWWNPFVYLLRRRLVVFQERHIDAVITEKLDKDHVLDYLLCLVKVAKSQSVLRSGSWIVEFNCKTDLQDRIKRLLESQNEKSTGKRYWIANILMAAMLIIFTLILPTLVTLEPDGGIPDEILEETFALTSENAYLILNEEGEYEVYIDGEYRFTSMQILEDTLHIYNEEGGLIQ